MSRGLSQSAWLAMLLFLAAPGEPMAQKKGMRPPPRALAEGTEQFLRATGLVPSFAGADCPGIASPFGSPTRFDGSPRLADRFGGLHGGMDVSVDERTPLLAVAAGQVVLRGAGGPLEGNYLWMQHSPEDTGLAFWVYAKYQHMVRVPEHAIGARLRVGEVVGLSGRTGTEGPHYGPMGYPHLHLTTVASPSGKYERDGSRIAAESARMFDPVAIYVKDLRSLDDIAALPPERKTVQVPFIVDGSVRPPGSRLVWPVACRPRS